MIENSVCSECLPPSKAIERKVGHHHPSESLRSFSRFKEEDDDEKSLFFFSFKTLQTRILT